MFVEKPRCLRTLVLSRSGYPLIYTQVAQKGSHLFGGRVVRMTLVVERDKPPYPVDVALFDVAGVVS